jgi:hypothetical protein
MTLLAVFKSLVMSLLMVSRKVEIRLQLLRHIEKLKVHSDVEKLYIYVIFFRPAP